MLIRLIRPRRDDERGAALIMVALTMVVLLGITAFVVDLGMGYNERRVSQTSADAAALGGIQYIATSKAKATEEAIEVARESLRADYTNELWRDLWASSAAPGNGCPSTAPSGYVFPPSTVIGGYTGVTTNCVMFNLGNTRMRVRVPNQIIKTSFAKVLGVSELKAAATAEAQIDFGGQGGVLPFGVLSTGGDGQEICLRDGPGGLAIPPCNGPDSGNFGALDAPFYGNPQYGTTTNCTGDPNGRLLWNLIHGIDHTLDEWRGPEEVPYDSSEAVRQDAATPGCQDVENPNWLTSQPGSGSYLHNALIGSNTPPARLRNTPYDTRTVTGKSGIDNKPLWEFIPTTLEDPDIPASCERSAFTANPTKAQLTLCFTDYNAGVVVNGYEPLFSLDSSSNDGGLYDIQKSPRFAFIPEYWTNDPADLSGTEQLGIKRFRSVYLQTIYIDCNATGCGTVFDPGDTSPGTLGASNKNAQMMSAMMFDNRMLPEPVWKSGPGGALRGANIQLVQ